MASSSSFSQRFSAPQIPDPLQLAKDDVYHRRIVTCVSPDNLAADDRSADKFSWLKAPRISDEVEGSPDRSSAAALFAWQAPRIPPQAEDQSSRSTWLKAPRIPPQAETEPVRITWQAPSIPPQTGSVRSSAPVHTRATKSRPSAKSVIDEKMEELMEIALKGSKANQIFGIYKKSSQPESAWSLYCLHEAATLGLPEAQFELAKVYGKASSSGTPGAPRKYWKWLNAAAESGVVEAQHKLGICLSMLDRQTEAREWFTQAAEVCQAAENALAALNLLSLGKAEFSEGFASSSASPSPSTLINTGRWSEEEHVLFLEGLRLFSGENMMAKIAEHVGTRTYIQVRSHYQKWKKRQSQQKSQPKSQPESKSQQKSQSQPQPQPESQPKSHVRKRGQGSSEQQHPAKKLKGELKKLSNHMQPVQQSRTGRMVVGKRISCYWPKHGRKWYPLTIISLREDEDGWWIVGKMDDDGQLTEEFHLKEKHRGTWWKVL